MENKTEKTVTEKVDGKKQTVEAEVFDGNLVLVRTEIKDKNGKKLKSKDGRQLYSYTVNGKVRGRDIRADFIPRDLGGYEPLDIIFDFELPVTLNFLEESLVDYSGNKNVRAVYFAQVVDEDGRVYKCEVKPQRQSDKALVDMLLNFVK